MWTSLYLRPSSRRATLFGALGSMVYTDETRLSRVSSLHDAGLSNEASCPPIQSSPSAWSQRRSQPRAQTATPAPATDLDAFMSRVLERRDDNWKKLQQYVLDERETFQLIGPGATPLYGVRRESTWFPRDGLFIKSPLRINGVTIGEEDRRKAEDDLDQARGQREKRARRTRRTRRRRAVETASTTPLTEDGVRQALEPGFVSAAYFLRFKFDPGHYALAGREQFEGRDVLKIEYYPSKLFSEGRTRPNKELRKRRRRDSRPR